MANYSIPTFAGGEFTVTLQSMVGSTSWGWCLVSMPGEIMLTRTYNELVEPVTRPIKPVPVNQNFCFLVDSSARPGVVIAKFQLVCLFDPSQKSDLVSVEIHIGKRNELGAANFAKYSENQMTTTLPPYGFNNESFVKYGYACTDYGFPCVNPTAQNATSFYGYACTEYGFPCNTANQAGNVVDKYGFPCSIGQDPSISKYGYPCSVNNSAQNTLLCYGYQCGVNDAVQNQTTLYSYPCNTSDIIYKYGYPCGVNDAVQNQTTLYSYPCNTSDMVHKYGYPCSIWQDPSISKYGYPCSIWQDPSISKYGYPCSIGQDSSISKYGYPCSIGRDSSISKYGYPCGVNDAVQNTSICYGYQCGVNDAISNLLVAYGYRCK